MKNIILQGDSLEQLKTLPDESINCVMTSPPYWALRDYGTATWEGGNINCKHQSAKEKSRYDYSMVNSPNQSQGKGTDAPKWKDVCPQCGAKKVDLQLGLEPTPQEYINKLCNIFDEVKRVLRKDGTCWVNLGDTYGGSNGVGWKETIENTNRKIGGGENKSLKKELGIQSGQAKSLCLIPFRFSIEMVNRGWILRNVIIWHKPNCMPSSVKDRFTVDFEYLFFFVKSNKYWFETQYEPHIWADRDKRSLLGRVEHKTGKTKLDNFQGGMNGVGYGEYGRNKRAVWKITTKPFKEAHFAVYPEELCETPIKAGCPEFVCNKCGNPREKIIELRSNETKRDLHLGTKYESEEDESLVEHGFHSGRKYKEPTKIDKGFASCFCNAGFSGGIVLDPFFGSGTTGIVALKQNKQFIGIELNKEYIEIANRRLKPYLEQRKL